MGVPFLFRHLCRRYPHVAGAAPARGLECGALLVDFNGVLHVCARRLLDADAGDALAADPAAFEARVVDDAVGHVRALAARAGLRPGGTVMVAVDGLPPRPKLAQQRCRRYMSSWRREQAAGRRDAGAWWDSNAITPGTAFMDRLAAALAAERAAPERWRPHALVASDSEEPGEGEQKMFEWLRAEVAAGREPAGGVLVYGLDADLLLMAAACPARDVRVLREPELGGALTLVDVPALRRALAAAMGAGDDAGAEQQAAACRDFVALCALAGNDFVPGLPSLGVREGATDALAGAYRRARAGGAPRLCGGGGGALGIDLGVLARVVGHLADAEDAALAERDAHYYQRVRSAARVPPHLRSPDDYPLLYPLPPVVRPGRDQPGWRLRYYHHLFGSSGAATVRDACVAYLAGVAWSAAYLAGGAVLSQHWHYPHAHAPCALDLTHVLAEGAAACEGWLRAHFDEAEAAAPPPPAAAVAGRATWWQLLQVLPPASAAALLPAPALRAAARDPSVAHLFPLTFRVAVYLRDKLWECTPVLPPVDARLLAAAVARAAATAAARC